MINHKLLTLFEGKCWHEWKCTSGHVAYTNTPTHRYDCVKCDKIVHEWKETREIDYSSPNTYMPFLQWFWREKMEMWEAFNRDLFDFAVWSKAGRKEAWLFSLTENNEPRIMVLLSEWLALPETRYAWGESKCNSCNGVGTWPDSGFERKPCPVCNGTGRIKAEWAKEVKDAD